MPSFIFVYTHIWYYYIRKAQCKQSQVGISEWVLMNALDIKAIDISAHNEKQFAAKSASHDSDDNNGNAKATATSNRQKSRQKKHI